MAKKTNTITCAACDATYSVTSECNEQLQFCPFCGEAALMPYDDLDPDDFGEFDEDDYPEDVDDEDE